MSVPHTDLEPHAVHGRDVDHATQTDPLLPAGATRVSLSLFPHPSFVARVLCQVEADQSEPLTTSSTQSP